MREMFAIPAFGLNKRSVPVFGFELWVVPKALPHNAFMLEFAVSPQIH